MNEEPNQLHSRKTINTKELYKIITEVNDKPSSKLLDSIRKRVNFRSSPRILPVLNIKPPKFPKATELFDSHGVRVNTIFTSRIKRFYIAPCKFTQLNRSESRGMSKNRVQVSRVINKNELEIGGVELSKSKKSLGKGVHGIRDLSNRVLNSKGKEVKGKMMMLQELLIKVESLSGWDAD